MRDISIERTTRAILHDAFRVDSQVPSGKLPEAGTSSVSPRLPYWLYIEKTRATAFSPYDLRKMAEGVDL